MIRFVLDMVRVLAMPCREHAELLSRQLDAPLAPGQRFGLRVHLLYCGGCRSFQKYLLRLRSLGETLGKQATDGAGIPDDVRARLEARLRAK